MAPRGRIPFPPDPLRDVLMKKPYGFLEFVVVAVALVVFIGLLASAFIPVSL